MAKTLIYLILFLLTLIGGYYIISTLQYINAVKNDDNPPSKHIIDMKNKEKAIIYKKNLLVDSIFSSVDSSKKQKNATAK